MYTEKVNRLLEKKTLTKDDKAEIKRIFNRNVEEAEMIKHRIQELEDERDQRLSARDTIVDMAKKETDKIYELLKITILKDSQLTKVHSCPRCGNIIIKSDNEPNMLVCQHCGYGQNEISGRF